MTHVPQVSGLSHPGQRVPTAAQPAWQGQFALVPGDRDWAEIAALIPAGRDTAGWGVHRVMGLETEFGVHAPANPGAGHAQLSTEVVNAYADLVTSQGGSVAGTEWDYGEESPLVDARGWTMPRSVAHPTQLTDEAPARLGEGYNEHGERVHLLMNLVLPNGARLYVDHAHPEYSSPETTNPLEAMVWDQAGDRVALAASQRIAEAPGSPQVLLYKNNTDNKSVSYGAHENYLVARELDFDELAARLLPFFTARQVICGAGRVGIGVTGRTPGFQISQRADFFEEQVGLETTIRRPIVNTRDEPHAAADRYRRLHVIIGDANLSQTSTWLRCGMTALVLSMIELGTCPRLELVDPVAALQTISHDPTLQATVPLTDRRQLTGVDLMEVYLEAAEAHAQRFGMDDPATQDVLVAWRETLDLLRSDVARLADRLDWVAKHQLLAGYRERYGLTWDDPRMGMLDLQYADLRLDKGLHHALVRRGSLRTLVEESVIQQAMHLPPSDTRAWLRGRTVGRFGASVAGASWDTLLLRPVADGPVHRFHQREPLLGTEEQSRGAFDDDADVQGLLRVLDAVDRERTPGTPA